MAVKLKGNLPKTDRNGLAPLETELVANRLSGKATVAVVVLGTTGIHSTVEDDWRNQPLLSILHIEPLVDDEARTVALGLLSRAAEVRTGKVTLDFGDDVNLGDLPAELEASVETYFLAEVRRMPKSEGDIVRLGLYTSTAGLVDERFITVVELPAELGDLPDGESRKFAYEELPLAVMEFGEAMLRDRGHDADDTVDAEIVEDSK